MQYKIIVDKQSRLNPTADKKEYVIDIEELRFKGDIYDSLIITADEDYVLRRLKLTEYYVLEELAEPVKEPLENINIELFEGDNYIYLVDMTGNKFYAEYLIKNDFNDTYATRKEMHSAIDLTAQNINLSVNQKLQNYSTTEEMNSAIDVKANEINNKVEKKVDEEKITGAYLILKINGDTSGAKINADIIDLSANDILNLLAGNTINLTSKNIIINSDALNIGTNGNIIMKDNGEGFSNSQFKIIRNNNDNIYLYLTSEQIVMKDETGQRLELGGGSILSEDSEGGSSTMYGSHLNVSDGQTGLFSVGPEYTYIKNLKYMEMSQFSLEKLKKNIEKLKINVLDVIRNSEIYQYNLKTEKDEDKKHIGFVIGKKYKTPLEVLSKEETGIDIYSMSAIEWKAIQELSQQVQELQNKLKEKEG